MAREGDMDQRGHQTGIDDADDDRRKFLKSCGKFAAITPPALAVLMTTTLRAQASSGRGDNNPPGGHHSHHGN